MISASNLATMLSVDMNAVKIKLHLGTAEEVFTYRVMSRSQFSYKIHSFNNY